MVEGSQRCVDIPIHFVVNGLAGVCTLYRHRTYYPPLPNANIGMTTVGIMTLDTRYPIHLNEQCVVIFYETAMFVLSD